MARPRKTTPAAPIAPGLETMNTNETINISDYCKARNLSEQSVRLVLEAIRPDDFDSTPAIPQSDLDYVLSVLSPAQPAQNNALPIAGSPATQAAQATGADSATPDHSVTSETQSLHDSQALWLSCAVSGIGGSINQQHGSQASNITLLDELIAASEEEIKLADVVAQFKNQQIIQNAAARDGQLVAQLREQRLHTRAGYFDALRGLQATTVDRPEITPDNLDLDAEITRLSNELGKSLTISG